MGMPQTLSVSPSRADSAAPAISPSSAPAWRASTQLSTEKFCAGSNAIRLTSWPSTSAGTMRCGATWATPGNAAIRWARSAGSVSSVGCTVSRLAVMFTNVARGTTRRSAPMREKLRAMPSRNAQPATKLAKPMPTPSITATPRKIARSRRRPTFCAAKRISSQRSCRRRDIAFSGRMTLISQQNVPGLVDLQAQVMGPASVRIDALAEAAIRVGDLLRARDRLESEDVERLLSRHAQPPVAAPFRRAREPPLGGLMLELRSRLLEISSQHGDRLPHQFRIRRRARAREAGGCAAEIPWVGRKVAPRGVERTEQHAPARRRLHEHRQHEGREHHRRRPPAARDEPRQDT